jgi:drug/metabolite transporter (DMT)-like permease
MRIKADLILLLVAVLWGSAFVAQRTAGLLGSVYVFNAARFLVAAILLIPFAFRSRPTKSQLLWTLAAGGVLFTASALQQAGLTSTTAGNAGFLTSLYVVMVPLVVLLGWGEKPRPPALIAVGLAAVGAYLLSAAGRFQVRPGDLLELGGAAFWALHVVLLGKYASRYDAVAFSAGQMTVASALNWIASLFIEPLVIPLSRDLLVAILYTAVVSLGLGYTLQIWGQRHTPPTDAALILGLESVFAALAGYAVLGERLSTIQLLGCAAIVLAVVLAQLGAWVRISSPGKVAGQS